ncbi:circularly permuted type 2 ATP-grasp protein, partial [Myxococcus llanfairpwllgwyngyllgogerychwyrndrobwllllantysiliogogogochensis]|uniref:circularly permuted type 2 ATP-grasp protein n=1 Tax=Myxococcus llanfairpwllgwyngyllgogerychwyrndrobwllllantysiliogogogochensis TaxID=2590453 RepID=UPI001C66FE04
YRTGGVVLANAIGTGVADDKSIYPYVPEMIRFYLGEQPILSNIPTWQCRKAEDLRYVLSNLELMVVKEVHGAGGYGMLVGPRSTKEEREAFRQRLLDLGGVAPATDNTPEAFASVLQRELAVLPKAAKEADLQLD